MFRLHWARRYFFYPGRCFYGSDGDSFAHGRSLISLHQAREL
ncbi:hypothetical protein PDR5_27470 [Pseudomonas sp. DR 5-09]|nr:hypothetical protein PDR5_27470 [Pseudomonas sp. DR 5-09]